MQFVKEKHRKGGILKVIRSFTQGIANEFRKNKFLYLLVAPAVILVVVFTYLPMFGIVMAFQDYLPFRGFFRSKWVGLENFRVFFTTPSAVSVIKNTFLISLYGLLWSFPVPIIFALALNEVRNNHYKKFVQTVSILPNFLSSTTTKKIDIDKTRIICYPIYREARQNYLPISLKHIGLRLCPL